MCASTVPEAVNGSHLAGSLIYISAWLLLAIFQVFQSHVVAVWLVFSNVLWLYPNCHIFMFCTSNAFLSFLSFKGTDNYDTDFSLVSLRCPRQTVNPYEWALDLIQSWRIFFAKAQRTLVCPPPSDSPKVAMNWTIILADSNGLYLMCRVPHHPSES